MNAHQTVAIIPARGGSKGLKRKNILPLCGKPLIAYSIEAALASSRVDRVLVSTEDEEIADIAVRHGAEVPFLRPARFASNLCAPGRAIDHLIHTLYGKKPDGLITVILYPTSPFRPKGLIDLLVDKVAGGCHQALSVAPFEVGRDSYFKLDKGQRLRSLYPPVPGQNGPDCRRPELGIFHRPVGLGSAHGFFPGRHSPSYYLHPVTDKISLIDIDYLEDFLLAESVLENNLFDFDGPCGL